MYLYSGFLVIIRIERFCWHERIRSNNARYTAHRKCEWNSNMMHEIYSFMNTVVLCNNIVPYTPYCSTGRRIKLSTYAKQSNRRCCNVKPLWFLDILIDEKRILRLDPAFICWFCFYSGSCNIHTYWGDGDWDENERISWDQLIYNISSLRLYF